MSIQQYSDWVRKYGCINSKKDFLRWKFAVHWRAKRLRCCFLLSTLPSFAGFIIILIFYLINIQDSFGTPLYAKQAFISSLAHIGTATFIVALPSLLFSLAMLNNLEKVDYNKLRKENDKYRKDEMRFISQHQNQNSSNFAIAQFGKYFKGEKP